MNAVAAYKIAKKAENDTRQIFRVSDFGDMYVFETCSVKKHSDSIFKMLLGGPRPVHPGFIVVNKETGEVHSWSHVEYLIEKGERVGNKEIEWISL